MSSPVLDHVLDQYRSSLGRGRHELETPALILDLPIVRRNIEVMAERMKGSTRIRPHAKTHKCPQVARLQLDAGAIGVTTATAWEAVALARSGIDDILVANEVAGIGKIGLLAEVARDATITIGVDSRAAAAAYSSAAVAAGSTLRVLLDADIGFNRCGVRSIEEALDLASYVESLRGLRLAGVMGWEGHAVLVDDREERRQVATEAIDRLTAVRDALSDAGFDMSIVSAGGTNTHDMTGADPRVTEIQAGVYVFMDQGFRDLVSGFTVGGLTVLASVVSRHGDTVVLDCGSKEIGTEWWGIPQPVSEDASTRGVHEAHLLLDAGPTCELEYGDVVELIPGHACTTVSLHEVYHVVEDGVVVDLWPILARGPGRGTAS